MTNLHDRVIEEMKKEHAQYYGTPVGWGSGFGYQPNDLYHRWVTSGGNVLGVRLDALGRIHILARGRRHGIPWRFIPPQFREEIQKIFVTDGDFHPRHNYGWIEEYVTRKPNLAPWQVNNSEYSSEWWITGAID
jgi:hypothetical protein